MLGDVYKRIIANTGAPVGTRGGVAYASYTNTLFDGWRVNSDARRVTMNAGISAPIGDATRVRLNLTGANNLFHIPGPLSAQEVAADPSQANATYNTRDERRFNRLARVGMSVEHDLAANQTIPAMAKEMFLAPSTVKTHVQRLYEKLGVSDRGSVVAEAMRRGLLE